MWDIGVIE
ncbi:Protein of unknown function [Bacillus cereus]|nr:Protein of unknown function [Bacillus mobilis]SCV22276.1 Protein of unknown function [Bacillus cereus]